MRLNPFSLGRLEIQRLLVARMLSLLPGLRPNKNDGCVFALRLDCCPQVDTILYCTHCACLSGVESCFAHRATPWRVTSRMLESLLKVEPSSGMVLLGSWP